MSGKKLKIIGELINNSYGRARKAFTNKDLEGYQNLARIQTELGASYLTLNIDGTQHIQVKMDEMLAFLPDLIPAIQEVTSLPLSFDNPAVEYHRIALQHYDTAKGGPPILNSLAASRVSLNEMIDLVSEYDTLAIVMASEKFTDQGSAQCLSAEDAYLAAKHFTQLLHDKAGRTNDQIIIDPGLAPVGADTYGLVNIGLDAMKMIHKDPDMNGIHMVVGLSNFSFGTPKFIRERLEKAYLTLAMRVGLDFALSNPEKTPQPLVENDPMVTNLEVALKQGRAINGESQEMAGFRQAEAIMDIYNKLDPEGFD